MGYLCSPCACLALHTAIPTPSFCGVWPAIPISLYIFGKCFHTLQLAFVLVQECHVQMYVHSLYWFTDEKLNATATGIHETSTCTITSGMYDIKNSGDSTWCLFFQKRKWWSGITVLCEHEWSRVCICMYVIQSHISTHVPVQYVVYSHSHTQTPLWP